MIYEFEGKTEKEAIDKAAVELGLERDGFDVEILEAQRGGLFKKALVKIRVHTDGPAPRRQPRSEAVSGRAASGTPPNTAAASLPPVSPEAKNEFERDLIAFVEGVVSRMGCEGNVVILYRESNKLSLRIDSPESAILIGRKGKTLDALQLLAMIYAGTHGFPEMRIVLDSENYRIHREENLVKLAYTVADRVRENRSSLLLEPMNPFERRIIHTTLNDISDVGTKSEGEGLIKQVRVFYKR
jgi:spoIIIJ-associated protein